MLLSWWHLLFVAKKPACGVAHKCAHVCKTAIAHAQCGGRDTFQRLVSPVFNCTAADGTVQVPTPLCRCLPHTACSSYPFLDFQRCIPHAYGVFACWLRSLLTTRSAGVRVRSVSRLTLWLRARQRGLGAIPDARPCLFVGNHQTYALDMGVLVQALVKERRIMPHGHAHPTIFRVHCTSFSSSKFHEKSLV